MQKYKPNNNCEKYFNTFEYCIINDNTEYSICNDYEILYRDCLKLHGEIDKLHTYHLRIKYNKN